MFNFLADHIPATPFDTNVWWLLIALILGLLFTLQALETAIEGTWPHQRRDNEYIPGARGIKTGWTFAALALIPGALAAICIVGVMLWKDLKAPDGMQLGSWLLVFGWLLFLAFGLNWFGWGRVLGTLGMIGPIAIGIVLLIADFLLVITLLDILPPLSEVAHAIRHGLETALPFL